MSLPVIYKPKNNCKKNNYHNHSGDTFRELIDLWTQEGFIDCIEYDGEFCWWGNIGEILLYDRPNFDWLYQVNPSYKLALFGNSPPSELKDGGNCYDNPWIFWGRRPFLVEDYHYNHYKSLKERVYDSIFIGKIENSVQAKYRKSFTISEWKKNVEYFDLVDGIPNIYKYTQDDYLTMLSESKFGVSMRGFGPKCNREIELFALGVVPLLMEDVDITYDDPPIENVHFFRIKTPNDIPTIIDNTSDETWLSMSNACKLWYRKNASIKGSFETTKNIINRFKTPESINTICTQNTWKDLDLLLSSLKKYNEGIPFYILCDTFVNEKLKEKWYDKLNINCKISLDEYTNKDRKQMEQENIIKDFWTLKNNAISYALQYHTDTLFVDSDIYFLDTVPLVNITKTIGICPHYIKKYNTDNYGYYNAGFIYINNCNGTGNEFVKWWKNSIPSSRFVDQACLEDAVNHFSYFEFPMTVDYGWWRLLECDNPNERFRKFKTDSNGKITYDNQILNSVHTHFYEKSFKLTIIFNNLLFSLLTIKNPEELTRIL